MKWDEYQLEQVDPSNTPCDANGAVAKGIGLAPDHLLRQQVYVDKL